MMQKIRKIIAVLNDFSTLDEVLSKTFSLSHTHHAQVEILYVQETPLFEIPNLFTKENSELLDTKAVKKELEKKVTEYNPTSPPVIFVQIDDTVNRVWALAREEKETLIITAYHSELTEDIIHKVSQRVLVVKTKNTSYDKIVLAIDIEDDTSTCVRDVKELFKEKKLQLFYDYRYSLDPRIELELSNIKIIEEVQRESFESILTKHALQGDFFINGFLLDEDLKKYFNKTKFDLIVSCCDEDVLLNADKLWVRLLKNVSIDIMIEDKSK